MNTCIYFNERSDNWISSDSVAMFLQFYFHCFYLLEYMFTIDEDGDIIL